jgi:hypothetical protein
MLRPFSILLLCGCLLTAPILAYDTELSDTALREAYFLGQRNDAKTRDFFASYTKNLPLPKKGPYVSEIRLLTPLAQVVQISSQTTSGYSAQQARLDYQNHGDSILFVVHIQLTATYGQIDADNSAKDAAGKSKGGLTLRREDFWQDFHYGLKQKEEWIEPRSMRGEPEYGGAESYQSSGLVGAWVYIEYDAHNVQSDDTEVHVITVPDQEVTVTFDLAKLR